MDFSKVEQNLKSRGFLVSVFETKEQAAEYLNKQIDKMTVGMGGSVTLDQLGLNESLSAHNTVYWHQHTPKDKSPKEIQKLAASAQVYLSSVNGLAETGEVVNIDGNSNRVSAILNGHEKVYLVVGSNKLAKDYDAALWRARNIATPLNAQRLKRDTPCAAKADRCYDCNSPARICRSLCVLWRAPGNCPYEIVLINSPLGY
jgi:hypothetical protein